MTRGVHYAVVVTGALLATLTGCTNGEARGKQPLPPLSATATSKSPTASASPTPSKATDPKAEAVAFIGQYFEAANLAAKTGDTGPWRALMTTECNCHEAAQYLDDKFASGSVRGLRFTVHKTSVQAASRNDAQATVTYAVSAYDELASDGSVRKHVRSFARVLDALSLQRAGDHLLMANVTRARLD